MKGRHFKYREPFGGDDSTTSHCALVKRSSKGGNTRLSLEHRLFTHLHAFQVSTQAMAHEGQWRRAGCFHPRYRNVKFIQDCSRTVSEQSFAFKLSGNLMLPSAFADIVWWRCGFDELTFTFFQDDLTVQSNPDFHLYILRYCSNGTAFELALFTVHVKVKPTYR